MNRVFGRMFLGALLGAVVPTAPVRAQWRGGAAEENTPLPDGPSVMSSVRQQMQGRIIEADGTLQTLNEDGEAMSSRAVRLVLDWGGERPGAVLTLSDAFGSVRARATLHLSKTRALEIAYETGDPLHPSPAPDPDSAVEGTDFTWRDLALDFLWWPGGLTEQEEMKLGRLCYVVRLPSPKPHDACTAVRLWVDAEARAMLQADTLDARGKMVRRLAVRSLRKTETGTWVVKDFEVSDHARRSRTLLTFQRVSERVRLDDPALPAATTGAPARPPHEIPPVVAIPEEPNPVSVHGTATP